MPTLGPCRCRQVAKIGEDGSGVGPGTQPVAKGVSLANRFELEQVAGRSVSGSSWLARDRRSARPCLVRLADGVELDPQMVGADYAREADASTRVRSDHVLNILAHGSHEGVPFIVQELLVGETLEQRVEHTGPVQSSLVLQYVAEAASALARAHGVGLVHGCLTPSRLFLARQSGREVVKLLDFGAGQLSSESGGPSRSSPHITAASSPEQLTAGIVTDLSDVWALAVVTFFALTGRLPFHADDESGMSEQILSAPIPSPLLYNPGLPAEVELWTTYALERNPADRYRTTSELALTLAQALGLPPHEVGSRPPSSSRGRSHPSAVGSQPRMGRLGSPGPWALASASSSGTSSVGQASPLARPPSSQPPPLVPASKPTILGVGVPAPLPTEKQRIPATIPGMVAVDRWTPPPLSRTILGVGSVPTGGPSSAIGTRTDDQSSQATAQAEQRFDPFVAKKTMLGIGNSSSGQRALPLPFTPPPPCPAPIAPGQLGAATGGAAPSAVEVAGVDLRKTALGVGPSPPPPEPRPAQPVAPREPWAPRAALSAVELTGADLGKTSLGMGPCPARRAESPAGPPPGQPSPGDFFVPRQSTLLGVPTNQAAELAAARQADRRMQAAPSGEPRGVAPDRSQQAASAPPARGDAFDAPAGLSASDSDGVPRTTLRPVAGGQRSPSREAGLPCADEPAATGSSDAPRLGGAPKDIVSEASIPGQLVSTLQSDSNSAWGARPDAASPLGRDGDATPRIPGYLDHERLVAPEVEPSVSESFPPSSLERQLFHKRKVLIIVVVSVVGLMLMLLVGALVARHLREGREPSLGSQPATDTPHAGSTPPSVEMTGSPSPAPRRTAPETTLVAQMAKNGASQNSQPAVSAELVKPRRRPNGAPESDSPPQRSPEPLGASPTNPPAESPPTESPPTESPPAESPEGAPQAPDTRMPEAPAAPSRPPSRGSGPDQPNYGI